MTFTEAVRTCLREKYATFSGRAARSEYWWFQLFYWIFIVVAAAVIFGLGGDEGAGFNSLGTVALIVFGIIFLGLIIPMLSVTVRRIHDLGYSGWWYLAYIILSAIPYIGALVGIGGLVVACLRGTQGPNQFGDDPLNPTGNLREVFS